MLIKNKIARVYVMPAIAGFLLTFCHPIGWDIHFGWLAWISLVPLFLVLKDAPKIELFFMGVVTGAVHFITGLYWITFTLNTYGNLNIIASFFVMLLLAFLETAYLIVFTLVAGRILKNYSRIPSVVVLPLLWVAVEYLRTITPFGGFPWLLLGYSQQPYPLLIQIADITGVYGVSFIVVLVNAVIVEVISWLYGLRKSTHENNNKKNFTKIARKWEGASSISIAVAVILIFLTLLYGKFRIDKLSKLIEDGVTLNVSLLQGNIAQDVKWTPEEDARIIEIYKRLTKESATGGAELIVWPEAATPFAIERDMRGFELLRWLENLDTYTIVGSIDYTFEGLNRKNAKFTNSAYLVTPKGVELSKYSKMHLVPFSEYIPFVKLLGFVDKLVKGAAGNFSPGKERVLFNLPKGKVGVIICYEAIFGDLVRRFRKGGAQLLVNITNDAWFGKSSAPFQHLCMSAFRCAENHCYLVRSANTGISAVVDPAGRILEKTDIFVEARLDAQVKMVDPQGTVYSIIGDFFAQVLFVISIALLGLDMFRERKKNKGRSS